MSKIKLKDAKLDENFHKVFIKSCRNKTLQQLILIWYNYNYSLEFRKKLKDRHPAKEYAMEDFYYIQAEDIMDLLDVSKRTAEDYKSAIQVMFGLK
jgi:hypothetical protein